MSYFQVAFPYRYYRRLARQSANSPICKSVASPCGTRGLMCWASAMWVLQNALTGDGIAAPVRLLAQWPGTEVIFDRTFGLKVETAALISPAGTGGDLIDIRIRRIHDVNYVWRMRDNCRCWRGRSGCVPAILTNPNGGDGDIAGICP